MRAQCAADPVTIAREIVRAKIAADKSALGPRVTPAMPRTLARCESALMTARSVAEIVMIEAKAASVTGARTAILDWSRLREATYRAHGCASRTGARARNFSAASTYLILISAMINYCVVVEAGLSGASTGRRGHGASNRLPP